MKKIYFILLVLFNITISSAQSDEVDKYIKKESVGGKLDFTKAVEEYKSYFIAYENIMYNKKDFGILLWGASVKNLGIKSFDKTIALWEEINMRKLTKPEKKALKVGFETKL